MNTMKHQMTTRQKNNKRQEMTRMKNDLRVFVACNVSSWQQPQRDKVSTKRVETTQRDEKQTQ